MRVLVCGGRDFENREWLYRVLDELHVERAIEVIIQGGARGADWMARDWARSRMVEGKTYEADWKKHGKAAGPKRNAVMLAEGKPDLVVAFPGGRGTADMVEKAEAAGVAVHDVRTLNSHAD